MEWESFLAKTWVTCSAAINPLRTAAERTSGVMSAPASVTLTWLAVHARPVAVLSDPVFWIRSEQPPIEKLHVAFATSTRESVDAFHKAALNTRGRAPAPPGPQAAIH